MAIAQAEEGTRERVRGIANPRIHEYFQATGFKAGDASTEWCSAFVNWVLREAGLARSGKAAARSWLSWGRGVDVPMYGAVTVFSRPPHNYHGHVAFYVREEKNYIHVLGGNQGNAVCVRPYPRSRLLGYRLPDFIEP
jgi:uncharacterized protein (TIGR02594 family)